MDNMYNIIATALTLMATISFLFFMFNTKMDQKAINKIGRNNNNILAQLEEKIVKRSWDTKHVKYKLGNNWLKYI